MTTLAQRPGLTIDPDLELAAGFWSVGHRNKPALSQLSNLEPLLWEGLRLGALYIYIERERALCQPAYVQQTPKIPYLRITRGSLRPLRCLFIKYHSSTNPPESQHPTFGPANWVFGWSAVCCLTSKDIKYSVGFTMNSHDCVTVTTLPYPCTYYSQETLV